MIKFQAFHVYNLPNKIRMSICLDVTLLTLTLKVGGITLAKSSLEGAVVENSQNFGTKESISVCAMFNFLFEMLAGKNSLTVHNGFQALTECLKYSIQYENSNINSNFS